MEDQWIHGSMDYIPLNGLKVSHPTDDRTSLPAARVLPQNQTPNTSSSKTWRSHLPTSDNTKHAFKNDHIDWNNRLFQPQQLRLCSLSPLKAQAAWSTELNEHPSTFLPAGPSCLLTPIELPGLPPLTESPTGDLHPTPGCRGSKHLPLLNLLPAH